MPIFIEIVLTIRKLSDKMGTLNKLQVRELIHDFITSYGMHGMRQTEAK